MRRMKWALAAGVTFGAGVLLHGPAAALAQTHHLPLGPPIIPLPDVPRQRDTRIYARGATRAPFPLVVTQFLGPKDVAELARGTLVRDAELANCFRLLDAAPAAAEVAREGLLRVERKPWLERGAEVVVKGSAELLDDGRIHLELALFQVSRSGASDAVGAALKRTFDVPKMEVRDSVHRFANDAVAHLTQVPTNFGTHLVFTAPIAEGKRGLFRVDADGQNLVRLPTLADKIHAPAYGPAGDIYYARGDHSLYRVGQASPAMTAPGTILGAAFSGSRVALVVASDGQSEIYVGNADGSELRKLTSGGINTHPAWGPKGELAYVSTRSGNPQVYVDGRRVSTRGTYNMAPTWCNGPEGVRLVFMGRDGSSWDILSVDPVGGPSSMLRLTQDAGSNTYPACSPDGRHVAFFSTRTADGGPGLYMMSVSGQGPVRLSSASGESLRWEGN